MLRFLALMTRSCAVVACTVLAAADAWACSCDAYNDPTRALTIAEVIVDGVVTDRDPIAGDFVDPTPKTAKMRIDQVWKGDVERVVTLHFNEASSMCGFAPPIGTRIRLGSISGSSTELYYSLCLELPLDDPELNRMLADYKQRSNQARQQADAAGRSGQLEFARNLRSNGEFHRALGIYQALRRIDPNDLDAVLGEAILQVAVYEPEKAKEILSEARRIAPQTQDANGKIARAEFEALGQFDVSWKDWSNLENIDHCNAKWHDFDGAVFDGARLRGCRFVGSTMKGASFKGADLSKSDPSGTELAGATFDCKTRFPPGFSPAAAGMRNVESSCSGAN